MNKFSEVLIALMLAGQVSATTPIAGLGWLAGSWQTADGAVLETWSDGRGGAMLGTGRTIQDGSLREYEFLRIQAGPDGVPVYWASPNGVAPVPFRLTLATANSATFENAAHDYPQRISYRRTGNRLVATISASDGSRAMTWTYRAR